MAKHNDYEIAVFEDPTGNLHFIPCDESQKSMLHLLKEECNCNPAYELVDNEGKQEKVLIHNKILH